MCGQTEGAPVSEKCYTHMCRTLSSPVCAGCCQHTEAMATMSIRTHCTDLHYSPALLSQHIRLITQQNSKLICSTLPHHWVCEVLKKLEKGRGGHVIT